MQSKSIYFNFDEEYLYKYNMSINRQNINIKEQNEKTRRQTANTA